MDSVPALQHLRRGQGTIALGPVNRSVCRLQVKARLESRSKPIRRHIWCKDKVWRPVRYNPGALVVNIGEALEIISGGHFKATRHKVTDTPTDQENEQRLSLVQFNASAGHLTLAPVMESPLIQREGFVLEQGVFQE